MFKNTNQKLNIHIEALSAIFLIILVSLFLIVNLFIGFILPLYLVAMGVSFLVAFFYPRSGLYAIIFLTMIFELNFTLTPFTIGKIGYRIYPLDILIIGTILGILTQCLAGLKKKRVDWILIGFIILNILYFFVSIFFLKADFSLAFSSLKSVAFYGLLYFIVFFLIRTEVDFKRLAKFFLAGAISIVGFIIAGLILGKGIWSELTPGLRLLAFTHGLFVSFALFALFAKLIFEQKKKFLQFDWKMALSIIWIIGIVGTMMRHLWLSIFASLAIVYFFLTRDKKIKFIKIVASISIFFSLAIFIALYISWMAPNSKVNEIINKSRVVIVTRGGSLASLEEDESASWRILVWKSAYEKYGKNFILGNGTGQKIFVEKKGYQAIINVREMHNSYFVMIVQLGFFGLGIFLYFVFLVVRKLIKLDNGNSSRNVYKYALMGCLSLFLVASLFQPYMETNTLNLFLWIMLGLARILPEIKFNQE
ncbi:MAG: O-antigen ligase family protein [Candidatus Moraniibacteriota bacterium]